MSSLIDLTDKAIKTALNQDWQTAIEINQQILEQEPENVATLNRLGFAYRQLGDIKKAREAYAKVLQIDKYNPIANKCIDRLKQLKVSDISNNPKQVRSLPNSFLEEPGKTKTVSLTRPADNSILAQLDPGIPVQLVKKQKRITVTTLKNQYVGSLPDDIGFRLIKLLSVGYSYEAYIKSCINKSVSVFIKEKSKGGGYSIPSFPPSGSIYATTPLSQVIDEAAPIDMTPTGEEEEFESY